MMTCNIESVAAVRKGVSESTWSSHFVDIDTVTSGHGIMWERCFWLNGWIFEYTSAVLIAMSFEVFV